MRRTGFFILFAMIPLVLALFATIIPANARAPNQICLWNQDSQISGDTRNGLQLMTVSSNILTSHINPVNSPWDELPVMPAMVTLCAESSHQNSVAAQHVDQFYTLAVNAHARNYRAYSTTANMAIVNKVVQTWHVDNAIDQIYVSGYLNVDQHVLVLQIRSAKASLEKLDLYLIRSSGHDPPLSNSNESYSFDYEPYALIMAKEGTVSCPLKCPS